MKRLGIPVVYYIGPQLWAWRAVADARRCSATSSKVLVIFPFEEALYRDAGVPVEFVGHPLVEMAEAAVAGRSIGRRCGTSLGLRPAAPTVALLPGSRRNELERLVPVLAERLPLLAAACSSRRSSSWRGRRTCRTTLFDAAAAGGAAPAPRRWSLVRDRDRRGAGGGRRRHHRVGHGHRAGRDSRLADGRDLQAVAADATRWASRSCAWTPTRCPTWSRARRIVPELIQDACTPARVAEETVALLADPARHAPHAARRLAPCATGSTLPGASAPRRRGGAACAAGAHAVLASPSGLAAVAG